METFFDSRNHPKIRLAVGGAKQSSLLEAILDTGFDGYLSLPINIAVTLGIELAAIIPVEYADGRRNQELVFSVKVSFGGMEETVPATLTAGAEALAGTALLAKYELGVNFPRRKITLQRVQK
jgi:predicted aspartyl protease